MFGIAAIPAAVKWIAIAVAVVVVIGMVYKVLDDAYDRGFAAAEAKAVAAIQAQRERFRAEMDRLRMLPDDKLDCELLRLTKPEHKCD